MSVFESYGDYTNDGYLSARFSYKFIEDKFKQYNPEDNSKQLYLFDMEKLKQKEYEIEF